MNAIPSIIDFNTNYIFEFRYFLAFIGGLIGMPLFIAADTHLQRFTALLIGAAGIIAPFFAIHAMPEGIPCFIFYTFLLSIIFYVTWQYLIHLNEQTSPSSCFSDESDANTPTTEPPDTRHFPM